MERTYGRQRKMPNVRLQVQLSGIDTLSSERGHRSKGFMTLSGASCSILELETGHLKPKMRMADTLSVARAVAWQLSSKRSWLQLKWNPGETWTTTAAERRG